MSGIKFCLALLLLLSLLPVGQAEDSLVGRPAPKISGKNAKDFGLLQLSSLTRSIYRQKTADGRYKEVEGKYVWDVQRNVVVINFFATYCKPCIEEIPIFNRFARRYRDAPVKLLYINIDPDTPIRKLRKLIVKHRIKIPMMVPNQYHAIKRYRVVSLPRIVLIDRNGNIDEVLVGLQENLENRLAAKIDGLLQR